MRPFIMVLTFALSVLCQTAPDQERFNRSHQLFREIMVEGSKVVAICELNNMEISKIDVDLVGRNSPKQVLKVMSTDYRYFITAKSLPTEITNLELYVYFMSKEGTSTFVTKSMVGGNTPVIAFKPEVAGDYMIVVKAAKMADEHINDMGFFFLAIAHN